ncbi:tyrosine-type recombinase/integrase [Candidatus Lokiarchaeum ossiferum]|uniref:tyrosine-type recombinase/integrase n=1 Tax=Candidatus Lokiarchaeum ossiferum TaxID=2951803 RepID=UPI00352CD61C
MNLVHESQQIVDHVFTRRRRNASLSANVYYRIVNRFLDYSNTSDFLNLTRIEADNFLNYLDETKIKEKTKKNYLIMLYTFFDEVEEYYRSKGIQYMNPFPKAKYYQFSRDRSLSLDEKEKKKIEKYLTVDQLLEILRGFYDAFYDKFIMILIMVMTGLRVSEVVSIRRENVRIDERYLFTGTEMNARKSGEIYAVFPKVVANLLFDYLEWIKQRDPTSVWLFPFENDNHHRAQCLRYHLKKLNFGYKINNHMFRRSIMTYWHRNEVPLEIIEQLSNHKPSSVSFQSYIQVTLDERRKKYDESFPEEYKKILNWLEKL